ncbi:MAG: PAS domain S-box protein [Spirulina sp. SIO3F2]|nr:PAS domain S-box protein [Spirulina sp. SIO3F2]
MSGFDCSTTTAADPLFEQEGPAPDSDPTEAVAVSRAASHAVSPDMIASDPPASEQTPPNWPAILGAIAPGVALTDHQGDHCQILVADAEGLLRPELGDQPLLRLFEAHQHAEIQQTLQMVIVEQRPVKIDSSQSIFGPWFTVTITPLADQLLWAFETITPEEPSTLQQSLSFEALETLFEERTTALQVTSDQLVDEVVERQQAETALKAILEAIPGIVSWIRADLKYLGVNSQLADMFGLTPADFVGKDIGFLQASSEFNDFVKEFFASDRMDDSREIDARVNGEPRTYLIVVRKYSKGRAAFSVGIDITQRVQALEDVERSKEQLQAVLEAVPGIVSWIGSDLKYMGVNRHLANTFNLKPQDFVGQPIGFLEASEDFGTFVEDFFAGSTDDAFREVEAIVDGEVRNYLIAAQKYDQGKAAFTVGIDVTARQQAIKDLGRSKEQLQAVLEAVPGIVSWISADLKYMGVNRQLARTFGLVPQDFVGQDIGFLSASQQFNEFVQDFFTTPIEDDFRQVKTLVNGVERSYLIAFQKYDDGQAAFTVGIDITDRQQALEDMRLAEEKYRNIFENAVEGIFQTTPEGFYLSANPALARIYGYDSPGQLMAELTDVASQLYVEPHKRQDFITELAQHGSVVGFELEIKRRDGKIRWISENARRVCDMHGDVLYYEGTVEDITDRKQAEAQLKQLNEELESRVQSRTQELQELNMQLIMEMGERERMQDALRTSEAELKALFSAMTDVITVFDYDGHYSKIVSTNSETLYAPHVDRMGKTVREVLPPATADLFMDYIQTAIDQERTLNWEYSLPVGHSQAWFAATISPLPNRSVMWVARNITERKKVLDALAAAEEKYRSIYENAAEGIFQTTLDGRYISANPALVKMYGYGSFAEMAARVTKIDEQLYVDTERRAQFRKQIDRFDSVTDFQTQVRRKDGTLIWTSENARIVRDEQGKPLYYEGTVNEITQRKQAEDALHMEREKSERLLLNILPPPIAERLKREEQAIAERHERATILFADIVNFTSLAAETSPTDLVDQLNKIFSIFDRFADWYELEKIKTIGDAYMVAGGMPGTTPDHVMAIADLALDVQHAITQFQRPDGQPFQLRIGIHTGPVVAGVIGLKKFTYDLWGDTVNIASRMESQGKPNQIQVTQVVYEQLRGEFRFDEESRIIDVRGRGQMETRWLLGRL